MNKAHEPHSAAIPMRGTVTGTPTGRLDLAGEFRGGLASAVVSLGILLPLGLLSFSALGPAAGSVGIRAAFAAVIVGGLVAAVVGGTVSPGSGPKTSTSLILAGFVAALAADPRLRTVHGLDIDAIVLLAALCVGVSGLLQIAFGLFRLGSLVGFVPQPVVAGFMDGIAVLIALAQFRTMAGVSSAAGPVTTTGAFGFSMGSLLLGLAARRS